MPEASDTERPRVGGAALLNGVLMKSPSSFAAVVRRANGELVVREEKLPVVKRTLTKLPFIRGVPALVSLLRLQSKLLRWSTSYLIADIEEAEAAEKAKGNAPDEPKPKPKNGKAGVGTAMLHALVLAGSLGAFAPEAPPEKSEEDEEPKPEPAKPARRDPPKEMPGSTLQSVLPVVAMIGLYIVFPQFAAEGILRLVGRPDLPPTAPLFQVFTAIAKVSVFVGLFGIFRLMSDFRDFLAYHGAEHKAIAAWDAKKDLSVVDTKPYSTAHARCGTTFVVMVALVSIGLFSVIGAFLPKIPGGRFAEHVGLFLMKLPIIPVLIGITFEIQMLFAKLDGTPLRALLWPGLLVQKMTTAEPDDAQLEVALASARATGWSSDDGYDQIFPDYDALAGASFAAPGVADESGRAPA